MKHFTKLILASSIAMSASAFAMESMEDEALAETTGQDGVTISITPPAGGITMSTVIHDADFFAGASGAGAIVIGNPLNAAPAVGHVATSITTPVGQAINILIDAAADVDGAGAGTGAALGINISIPASTVIQTGTISAAVSNGQGAAVTGQTAVIMDNTQITLGATTLKMTLGNEAPASALVTGGSMMRLTTNMTGGLLLSNFALRDANGGNGNAASGGSAIRAGSITIDDAGAGTNLAVDAKIDVVPTGLVVDLFALGTGGMDMKISGLRFGSTSTTDNVAIGNVDVIGLNLAGTKIGIAGH